MAKLVTDIGSFVLAELQGSGVGFLALVVDEMVEQEMPHAQLLCYSGGRFSVLGAVPWHVKALFALEKDVLLVVGEYGDFAILSKGAIEQSKITAPLGGPEARGPLRRGKRIDEVPIVVGMDRQVYVWNSAEWETMEKGLPRLDEEVAGFEAIAGFSMSEIYCAGWYGEIWRSDGIQWEKLDSPTSAVITNIACGDDGFVYACGRRGLLIRGRNDSWEVIETGAEVEDFWGITWFQGKLYLSSMTGVSYLEDNQLYPVGFGDDTIATFYELAATTDALWSIGAKDLMSFDGETWTRIE